MSLCRCCGHNPCLCHEPEFEDCVELRDRDAILKLLAERNWLRDALRARVQLAPPAGPEREP